jgi:hypothetical protein
LKVIGAVTQGMVKREELARMREMGRPGMGELTEEARPKITKRKQAVVVADRVVGGVLSNTVGRVARFAGRRILGEVPDLAKNGSFDETQPKAVPDVKGTENSSEPASIADIEGAELIEEAISEQLNKDASEKVKIDSEDEALFRGLYKDEAGTQQKPDESRVAV